MSAERVLREAVAELIELVGEEQAAHLVADLADTIKAGRRPFDEVVHFLQVDAQARGDAAAIEQAEFAAAWQAAGRRPGAPGQSDPGGRPNRVEFYTDLHAQAADKEAVLRLAEGQLSKTSFYRLRKELGLV